MSVATLPCMPRYYPWGGMRSIVCDTAYGRLVITKASPTRLQFMLYIRGRRVRPSPRMVQLVCVKHMEETSGHGNVAYDGDAVIPMNININYDGTLGELYEEMVTWFNDCITCTVLSRVRWESANCENMVNADWLYEGFEIRPVPPAAQAECYMTFRRRSTTAHAYTGHVWCECEPYEVGW